MEKDTVEESEKTEENESFNSSDISEEDSDEEFYENKKNDNIDVKEEYVEEEYQVPDDIDMEQLIDYLIWLGGEYPQDSEFLWVAEEALKAPLPPSWKFYSSKDDSNADHFFFNIKTGESTYDHPLDEYYKQYFARLKAQKKNIKDVQVTSEEEEENDHIIEKDSLKEDLMQIMREHEETMLQNQKDKFELLLALQQSKHSKQLSEEQVHFLKEIQEMHKEQEKEILDLTKEFDLQRQLHQKQITMENERHAQTLESLRIKHKREVEFVESGMFDSFMISFQKMQNEMKQQFQNELDQMKSQMNELISKNISQTKE